MSVPRGHSVSAPSDAEPAPRARAWQVLLALLLPLAAVLAAFVLHRGGDAPVTHVPAEHSALQLDLARPDALIESASLAELPRDLLAQPLLGDLLTEDFVSYYQHNADRLGLAGTIRRLAYEHDLPLRDSLIAEVLDNPAEIALWRSADGRLAHAVLRLQRNALERVLEPLAGFAAGDRQLAEVGTLPFADDEAVPVYRLSYGAGRALLFASHGDRLLVATSPGMLLDQDSPNGAPGAPEARVFAGWLSGDHVFAGRFGLPSRQVRQRVTVAASALTLGYGRFVPALDGLRADFDGHDWRMHMAVDGAAPFAGRGLWQAMPMAAAGCAAAPVERTRIAPILERLLEPSSDTGALIQALGGPVALCWYPKSRLYTPLIVSRLADAGAGHDDALAAAFARYIGASEPALEQRFPVEREQRDGGPVWRRIVGSRYGLMPARSAPEPDALAADAYFRIALARHGDLLLFSLDERLVDDALAVLDRRYPPLADQLPAGEIPLFLAPARLATLFEQETLDALPADVEAVFRNAAERSLLPKLRALGTHAPVAAVLPPAPADAGAWTWLPVDWRPL